MENEQPNYYAVIPAQIRYSDIPAQAKLLYGEITALCNAKGYSWATNKYFAKLYNVSEYTVSRWISKLKAKGFIIVELTKAEKGKEVSRKLVIKEQDLLTKRARPIDEKSKGGIDEKSKENNTSINNTYNIDYIHSLIKGENTKDLEDKFLISKKDVIYVAECLLDWCEGKGKKYKNYNSAMRNWIRSKIEENKIKKKDPYMYDDNI
jgi:transposase